MLKTKIKKVLPYWLMGILLISALQIGGAYLFNVSKVVTAEAQNSAQPQVLGDATSIRGSDFESSSTEITKLTEPDTSDIKAKAFLVFDLNSGQELLQKNNSDKFYIASLTKLLTGLVTYQNVDLNSDVTITKKDILKVKPDLDFRVGDSLKASDIFNSMLIGSCNDAALALANYTASSTGVDFIDLMNRQAQALGMQNSHFENPMGFDSQQNYSTADDLKKLIIATQALAVFKNLGRRTGYEFNSELGNNYSIVATNTLLKNHPDIEAIKTGYTGEAGGAMATKIEIGNREIVILVLNSPDREGDTLKLKQILEQNFRY